MAEAYGGWWQRADAAGRRGGERAGLALVIPHRRAGHLLDFLGHRHIVLLTIFRPACVAGTRGSVQVACWLGQTTWGGIGQGDLGTLGYPKELLRGNTLLATDEPGRPKNHYSGLDTLSTQALLRLFIFCAGHRGASQHMPFGRRMACALEKQYGVALTRRSMVVALSPARMRMCRACDELRKSSLR